MSETGFSDRLEHPQDHLTGETPESTQLYRFAGRSAPYTFQAYAPCPDAIDRCNVPCRHAPIR